MEDLSEADEGNSWGLPRAWRLKSDPENRTKRQTEVLTNVTIEELVKLSIFKIDGDFIRKAKAEGLPLEVERLVQKRLGVAQKRAM